MAIKSSSSWALKYRPRKFESIVGQESAVATLKGMLKREEVPNTMLLTGPYGTGKTTLARMFAMYVNCETHNLCGKCKSCAYKRAGQHPDITEMNAAAQRGIDDVRSLLDRAALKPTTNIRFFILDELHQWTQQASNAALKTLEEPAQTTAFILCTNEPQKMLSTILSRATHVPLSPVTVDAMVKRLQVIAKHEKIKPDAETLKRIANASDGHVRDAVTLLQTWANAKSGGGDAAALDRAVGGAMASSAVAQKLLLSMYVRNPKSAASAIFDLQDSGDSAIPFMNMVLRMNEYVLASLIDSPKVWHTPENKAFRALLNDKCKDNVSIRSAVAIEAQLTKARAALQYSGVADRSVLLQSILEPSSVWSKPKAKA